MDEERVIHVVQQLLLFCCDSNRGAAFLNISVACTLSH